MVGICVHGTPYTRWFLVSLSTQLVGQGRKSLMRSEAALAFVAGRERGGGDVGVAVQAQHADGQAAQRCHNAGCISGSD
jgi:hypothetical protein